MGELPTWLVDLVGNFEEAWFSYSDELIALLPRDRDHASDSGGRQRDIFPLPPLPLDVTVIGLPCCASLRKVDSMPLLVLLISLSVVLMRWPLFVASGPELPSRLLSANLKVCAWRRLPG